MTYTGSKRPAGYVPLKLLAQAMRADIAQLIKEGTLPGKRSDYSVRVRKSGWTGAIDITYKLPHFWTTEYRAAFDEHVRVLDDEGEKVRSALQTIHDDYNYDNSDIQFDYFDRGYSGGVEFMTESGYPAHPGRRFS